MTRPRRGLSRLVAAALAAASIAASIAAAPPAEARSGTPPVTVPDSVTTYPDNFEQVDLLRNDSDAEGDKLIVCDQGDESYPGIAVDVTKKDALVTVRNARPGSYTFTYVACDGTTRTPGTLTVVVAKPPKITVRAVRAAPGRMRVTSKAPFRIRIAYGSFAEDEPDGFVTVPRHGTRFFTVHRTRIDWVADSLDGLFVTRGHVRGIRLP